jgi:hypothetical protein
MRKYIERLTALAAGAALAWAFAAQAATFNLFNPANGILVGNPNTYVTTAATSSNVRALWSGTCDSTTFLRADGTCVAAGAGSVTSVGVTNTGGNLSVTGSPITTSGNINIDLGANVPLLNASNVFTGGAQTISHAATARLILTDGASSVYLANDASNAYMQSTADEVFQVYIGSSNFLAAEFGTTAATTKLAGVDATDFARLSQANVFTANQTLSKSSPVIALRDTSGSGSAVAAYVSLGDASTERGWVGFGAGTAVMGVTNNIGALALSATAITLNGKDLGAAVTTGAQTATFSATNKPGAGTAGPTTWLPITVSGTTYYIPCFGAG